MSTPQLPPRGPNEGTTVDTNLTKTGDKLVGGHLATTRTTERTVNDTLRPNEAAARLPHSLSKLSAYLNAPHKEVSTLKLPENWVMGTLVVDNNHLSDFKLFCDTGTGVALTQTLSIEQDGRHYFQVVFSSEKTMNTIVSMLTAHFARSHLPEDRVVTHIPRHGLQNPRGKTLETYIPVDQPGQVFMLDPDGAIASAAATIIDPQITEEDCFYGATANSVRTYSDEATRPLQPINGPASFFVIDLNSVKTDDAHKAVQKFKEDMALSQGAMVAAVGNAVVVLSYAEQSEVQRLEDGVQLLAQHGIKTECGSGTIAATKGQPTFSITHVNFDQVGRLHGKRFPTSVDTVEGELRQVKIPATSVHRDLAKRIRAAQRAKADRIPNADARLVKYGDPLLLDTPDGTFCTGIERDYGKEVTSNIIGAEAKANFKALIESLESDEVRHIDLQGDGGTGKTTLLVNALRSRNISALICAPVDAHRDLPGMAMVNIFRDIDRVLNAESNGQRPKSYELGIFWDLMHNKDGSTKDVGELRQLLSNDKSRKNEFSKAAMALRVMGKNLVIEDLHQMGVGLPHVEEFLTVFIEKCPTKKLITTGRRSYEGEQHTVTNISEKATGRGGKSTEIHVKGIDFTVGENCIEKMRDCLGEERMREISKTKHDPESPLPSLDIASAVKIGELAGGKLGNPLLFEEYVANLDYAKLLTLREDGTIGLDAEGFTFVDNMKLEGSHMKFAVRRLMDLRLDPTIGESLQVAIEAIALMGRISEVRLRDLLNRLPQTMRDETKINRALTRLEEGKQIRKMEDVATGESFYVIKNDTIRDMLVDPTNMTLDQQARTAKMLDDGVKAAGDDIVAGFALKMRRVRAVPQTIFDAPLSSDVAAFLESFSTRGQEYLNELKGRNSVEETASITSRMLEVPIIQTMVAKLKAGTVRANDIELQFAAFVGRVLMENAQALCDKSLAKEASAPLAELETIAQTESGGDFVNTWDFTRLKFNHCGLSALSIDDPDGKKNGYAQLIKLHQSLASEIEKMQGAENQIQLRGQLHVPRPLNTVDEKTFRLAEYAIDTARLYSVPIIEGAHYPDLDFKPVNAAMATIMQKKGQQQSPAMTALRKVNGAWKGKFHGMPWSGYLEMQRTYGVNVQLSKLRASLEGKHFELAAGGEIYKHRSEETFNECPLVLEATASETTVLSKFDYFASMLSTGTPTYADTTSVIKDIALLINGLPFKIDYPTETLERDIQKANSLLSDATEYMRRYWNIWGKHDMYDESGTVIGRYKSGPEKEAALLACRNAANESAKPCATFLVPLIDRLKASCQRAIDGKRPQLTACAKNLEGLLGEIKDHPAAITTAQQASIYSAASRVYKLTGDFDDGEKMAKEGFSISVNTGNPLPALKCLKQLGDTAMLKSRIRKTGGEGAEKKWEVRDVTAIAPIVEALAFIESETAKTVVSNCAEHKYWIYQHLVMRAELYASYFAHYNPQVIAKLVDDASTRVMGPGVKEKKADAVEKLTEISQFLAAGMAAFAELEEFAPVSNGRSEQTKKSRSYYSGSNAAPMMQTADALRALLAERPIHNVTAENIPQLDSLQSIQGSTLIRALMHSVLNYQPDPVYAGPTHQRIVNALPHAAQHTANLQDFLKLTVDTVARFGIDTSGRLPQDPINPERNPNPSPSLILVGTNLHFAKERNIVETEVSPYCATILRSIKDEAEKRLAAQSGAESADQLRLTIAECSSLLGESNKAYHAIIDLSPAATPEQREKAQKLILRTQFSELNATLSPTGDTSKRTPTALYGQPNAHTLQHADRFFDFYTNLDDQQPVTEVSAENIEATTMSLCTARDWLRIFIPHPDVARDASSRGETWMQESKSRWTATEVHKFADIAQSVVVKLQALDAYTHAALDGKIPNGPTHPQLLFLANVVAATSNAVLDAITHFSNAAEFEKVILALQSVQLFKPENANVRGNFARALEGLSEVTPRVSAIILESFDLLRHFSPRIVDVY